LVTTEVSGYQSSFVGNEGDVKPVDGIINGSTFVEIVDEGLNVYLFDGESKKWISVSGSSGSSGGKGIQDAPTDGKNYVRYNAMWKEMPTIDTSVLIGANKDLSNLTDIGNLKFLASTYEDEDIKTEVSNHNGGVSRIIKSKKNSQTVTDASSVGTQGGNHEISVRHSEHEDDYCGIYVNKDELLISASKEDKVSEGYPADVVKRVEIYMRPEFNRPILRSFYGDYGFNGEIAVLEDVNVKVDKEAGKQLSQENFTTAEKAKLSGLESSHFKGSYLTVAALNTAHPTSEDGGYAYVGTSEEEAVNYIWDVENNQWTLGGKGTNDTPAQVKAKYESNPDTNVFTDAEKQKLATLPSTIDSLGATTWTTTFKTDEPYDSMKVYNMEYGTTNAFRGGNTIKYGDSLISTEGKTYFVTMGCEKGSSANVVFRAQRVEDHEITGKPGEKGEPGRDGMQGAPGLPGRDGTNGKDGIGLVDIVFGEVDTGRKDPWGDKIYRFTSIGKTVGVASQQGELLVQGVKRMWNYGGCFGDGTAQTPLGGYLAVATDNNFPYTAYPHIVGSDIYLYHYLLKDKLDFYVYVEYTKVTP
jgi:hypothetical protein